MGRVFMRKKMILLLDIFMFILIMLSGCTSDTTNDVVTGWIAKDSYFVDYKITGDKIKFRYSVCYYNDTLDPIDIGMAAKFNKRELRGWLKDENFFFGMDDDGNMKYETINPKEKKNIVFCFEGDYLGGSVNKNLSFPEEIILVAKDPEND